MPVQTCIFDLGNVLLFFSHDLMVQNMATVGSTSEHVVREFLFNGGFQKAFESGELTEQQFHAEFESWCGTSVTLEDFRLAVGDIFELNVPMIPLLEQLRSVGVRLVLLSNTCVTHIEFVRSSWNVLDLFDAITTSWEVGALKPDPRIYESALAQANCDAADCFFTDDIEDYVRQARSMGIQAHVFQDASTTRATLRSLGIELK